MPQAYSVSVIIPVINEVRSFRAVLDTLLKNSQDAIGEFIAVVCDRTTPQSLEVCAEWESSLLGKFRICRQTIPGLGGALRKGFEEARGSHILVIFSDGEADPASAPSMIKASQERPTAIILASRWIEGGGFKRYGPFKWMVNYLGQKFISALYRSPVTDYTFGYRIYPSSVARLFDWEEASHCFVPESILKPIRAGVAVIEIPAVWRSRSEGSSKMSLASYMKYIDVVRRYRNYEGPCFKESA